MSTKENKELVRQLLKEVVQTGGDAAKLRSLYKKYYAPELILHLGSRDLNLEQLIQFDANIMTAFPDFNDSIHDMIAEGDKVVTRYTLKGTHKGTFMGVPATGKQLVSYGVEIDRIVGGKIVETWMTSGSSFQSQLGAVPGGVAKK